MNRGDRSVFMIGIFHFTSPENMQLTCYQLLCFYAIFENVCHNNDIKFMTIKRQFALVLF